MQIYRSVGESLLAMAAMIMLAAPVMAAEKETKPANGGSWEERIQIFYLNRDRDQDRDRDQGRDRNRDCKTVVNYDGDRLLTINGNGVGDGSGPQCYRIGFYQYCWGEEEA